ncbi:hypothetical protein BVRB_7g172760 [Beta vulgaris subsp. vulgaris]|nr:hypothetical protein BVRB_7g172760 [Beta vulgaris subsp. vulgaris]
MHVMCYLAAENMLACGCEQHCKMYKQPGMVFCTFKIPCCIIISSICAPFSFFNTGFV